MKKILYVIIGLVVLYLILCLLGPKDFAASRSISIKAPAALVQTQMADFKFFQEKWSPWSELDPAMKTTYEGETGKPGYKYSWESNVKDVGKGSMLLNGIKGDTTDITINFEGMGDSKVYYIAKDENGSTSVTWSMNGEASFLMRGMMLFMSMDKMMGPTFEKGLNKLKTSIESMPVEAPKATAYEVKEVQWEERTYVGKKGTFTYDKLPAFFNENFSKIFEELGKVKIQPIAPATAIFFTWNTEKQETECAAVAAVAKGTKVKGWEVWNIPSSKILQTTYWGAYDEKMMDAYKALDAYANEKNLTKNFSLEEYVTDPMNEKDTAKWQTNIYYVLK